LNALKEAEDAGQIALKEKLQSQLIINKYESILYGARIYYVIDETMIVDFVKKCKKGLRLDYVKNFIRPIPKQVIERKKMADSLEVFDNYAVLHYDPEMKSYSDTKKDSEEKERKKDPILFGLISGSNKLYYIADWTY
jgi:hypothetical protein